MFGGLFGGKSKKVRNDIMFVLEKTYRLQVDRSTYGSIDVVVDRYASTHNMHDMAIEYLCMFVEEINVDHPKAKQEVEKYIRFSKGSYNRGLSVNKASLTKLHDAIEKRFGVSADSIESA